MQLSTMPRYIDITVNVPSLTFTTCYAVAGECTPYQCGNAGSCKEIVTDAFDVSGRMQQAQTETYNQFCSYGILAEGQTDCVDTLLGVGSLGSLLVTDTPMAHNTAAACSCLEGSGALYVWGYAELTASGTATKSCELFLTIGSRLWCSPVCNCNLSSYTLKSSFKKSFDVNMTCSGCQNSPTFSGSFSTSTDINDCFYCNCTPSTLIPSLFITSAPAASCGYASESTLFTTWESTYTASTDPAITIPFQFG